MLQGKLSSSSSVFICLRGIATACVGNTVREHRVAKHPLGQDIAMVIDRLNQDPHPRLSNKRVLESIGGRCGSGAVRERRGDRR
jgi:hypothetical protein